MTRHNKNRRIWLPIALLVGVGLLFAVGAPAQAAFIPLKVHNGALDPQNDEGWPVHHGDNPGGTQSWGPIHNDNGTGVDAWYIYDTSSAGNTLHRYRQIPTAAQLSYLHDVGWIMRTTLRVPDEAGAPSYGSMLGFRDGSKSWSMLFGLAGGDTSVQLVGGQSYTLTGQGNEDYHDFALHYDPGTDTAQLYVDGTAQLSPISGVSTTWTDFYFGSNSSGATGWAHYNHVSLVPEPGSAVMLLAGGLALALAGFRRKWRVV